MWKTIASFAKVIEVFYLFYPFLKTIRPFHHFDIPRFYVNFFFSMCTFECVTPVYYGDENGFWCIKYLQRFLSICL